MVKNNYRDIRRRIEQEPLWYDEFGVPRYCEFSPNVTGRTYIDECCLMLILCQNCRREFIVCMSNDRSLPRSSSQFVVLADLVKSKIIHYGDPPNICCCPAGYTMNSVPVRVIEFWARENSDWVRKPDLEIELDPDY